MPPKLSYGLNIPSNKKPGPPTLGAKVNLTAGQKRKKTVFDDSDSEEERDEERGGNQDGAIEITTLGGLDDGLEDTRPQEEGSKKPKSIGLSTVQPPGEMMGMRPLKRSVFDDVDDEGNQQHADRENGGSSETPSQKKVGLQPTGTNKDYTNLAALHSSNKYAKEAEEIDPSIYSYDAVYDSIKAKREKSSNKNANGEQGSSQYMEALMRSAEVRKRDQLRARDRLLAREREAEGDEFADKEKFVTAAYRAQQEEVKRMEEEEAKREKEEEERRKRNGGTGMMGFYRDMLARDEEQHGEAVTAAQEAARKVAVGESPVAAGEEDGQKKEKTEAQLAAEMNARGANIVVNDEGQIVDKRQLLSAGLNVAPKPKAKPSTTSSAAGSSRPGDRGLSNEASFSRNAQRARQTEMIAAQLEERTRQEEEAEAARQRQLAEKNRSQKTESDVSSARERYLARKRENEARQANGGG
jgi:hypothetical protein